MQNKIENRGGVRIGAGRKPLQEGEKRVKLFISCSKEKADLVKDKAEEKGLTTSAFILENFEKGFDMTDYIIDLWDYSRITPNNPEPAHLGQGYRISCSESDIEDIAERMSRYKIYDGVKVYEVKAKITKLN